MSSERKPKAVGTNLPATDTGGNPTRTGAARARRAVLAGSVGTTLEVFDLTIYSLAAATVFPVVFFPSFSATAGILAAFATFGVGYLARPVGGIVMAHFGDRIGRKRVLQFTLYLMGAATFLVGILPGYDLIGIAAPILLVVLRLAQGFAAGGEVGGAVVVVLENAPPNRQATLGSTVFAGAAVGGLLGSLSFLVISQRIPADQFVVWGWRIPFIASILVMAFGVYVRLRLAESADFEKAVQENAIERFPLLVVLRRHIRLVLLIGGCLVAHTGLSAIMLTFTVGYLNNNVGVPRTETFGIVVATSLAMLIATLLGGFIADRIGLRRVMIAGFVYCIAIAFPVFALINTAELPLIYLAMAIFAFGVGFISGAMGTYFAKQFTPELRYSGFSVAYQGAAILGGGIAPFVAAAIVASGVGSAGVSWYIVGLSALALVCLVLFRGTPKKPAPSTSER